MAVNPKSLENLSNITDRLTKEELSENGKKGGAASAKVRREKREMKDLAIEILNMNIKGGEAEEFQNIADSKGKNMTLMQSMILALSKKALKGDVKAFECLRDTAGMKPVEKQEIKTQINNGKLGDILKAIQDDNDEDENENNE